MHYIICKYDLLPNKLHLYEKIHFKIHNDVTENKISSLAS